jgi:hypothetical protein
MIDWHFEQQMSNWQSGTLQFSWSALRSTNHGVLKQRKTWPPNLRAA